MTYQDIISNVDVAYSAINERMQRCKNENSARGIVLERVTFEDIDLDDMLEPVLLPLLPELIENYGKLPIEIRIKAYRVYVASLCELVKNGLVNGGILKTMDARIGVVFDRNHHYDLLQRALRHEGIPIIQKHRKYEETIINEAGIPRGYHKKCLEIFSIYWKWSKSLDYADRSQFVVDYFNGTPIDRILIVDSNDSNRLSYLRTETASFSEKIIKTCLKLDVVFSAIDAYPESITPENLDEVADEISTSIGFNIFSVLRSDDIYDYILEYAKKVSFLKFMRLLENLPSNEDIILPNGTRKRNSAYSFENYIGGCHIVRGNTYEVSYPISLDIDSVFALPKYQIIMFGNAVIYTSDEPIIAEIDGIQKTGRTFVNKDREILYVFYERIGPATFAYIDDQPVNITKPFLKRTYLGKYWDHEVRQYKIGLVLDDIKYVSRSNIMKPVRILCNGRELYRGATNSHGSFRIVEKIIGLDQIDLNDNIVLSFYVNNTLIEEWKHEPEDYYLWARQTGQRVTGDIKISEWVGAPDVILFTKDKEENSCDAEFLYESQGYNVYNVKVDFSKEALVLNCVTIPIIKSETPFLRLTSPFEVYSELICVTETAPISIVIENDPSEDSGTILQVEYENDCVSYNIRNLGADDYQDVRKLVTRAKNNSNGYAGNWAISLFHDNKKINSIAIVVLPSIRMELEQHIYAEGETASVRAVSDYPCFESEGEYVTCKTFALGRAHLALDGNYVYVKPIDVSVYIDRCGVTKSYQVTPRVWGIRKKSETTQLWHSDSVKSLPIEELTDNSIYVCSTGNTSIRIETKDDSMNRFIVPGFSRINCRRLFNNWHFKNPVTLTDKLGSIQQFALECNPKFEYLDREQIENETIFYIRYTGPISTTLQIRAFSERRMIAQISRNVYRNKFVTKVSVASCLVLGKQVTIEARVGEQDYQTIASEKVEVVSQPEREGCLLFSIGGGTRLIELLEQSCIANCEKKKRVKNQLIAMLEQGGKP